ncbi:MAG: hypothetical protein KA902_03625, partial [Arenimonas sp.]|nr:hypothetical protein [Arenimonas sp.]
TLLQFRENFETETQWQDFLQFMDSHKVRGNPDELWLQWEIHLLECQAMKPEWHGQDGHYMSSEMRASSAQFQ